MKRSINQRFVDGIKFDRLRVELGKAAGARLEIFDAKLAGFGVRVTANGAISYFYLYSVSRRRRRLTLGSHPILSAAAARDAALQAAAEVRAGGDPANKKRVDRDALSVDETFKLFLDAPVSGAKHRDDKRSPRTVENYRQQYRQHVCPTIGKVPVKAVEKADIERVVRSAERGKDGEGGHHGQANVVLNLVKAIMRYAYEEELVDQQPRYPKPHRRKAREVRLTLSDLADLGAALDQAEANGWSLIPLTVFRFLLLTGMRAGEAEQLRWDGVDFEAKRITYTVYKGAARAGHVPRSILLTEPVADLLETAKLWRRRGNLYVFPAEQGPGHTGAVEHSWWVFRLKYLSGHSALAKLTRHDLRHAFAGFGAGHLGLGAEALKDLLHHAQTTTTEGYIDIGSDVIDAHAAALADGLAAALRASEAHAGKAPSAPNQTAHARGPTGP